MRNALLLSVFTLVLAGMATVQPSDPDPEKGKELYQTCIACHGDDGAGNATLNAPRLAGQSGWYLRRQLSNFKSGVRGAHKDDTFGAQMRPMAMILADEKAIEDIASYIVTLKGAPAEPTIEGGDVEKGKSLYIVCQACHGTRAEGVEALNGPRLAGLQDWYLMRQLKNFKTGVRGSDPKDTFGAQMRPMTMTLADDEAIRDVVAFIQTLE